MTLPEYRDDLMGLPVILVDAVVQTVCDDCGAVVSTRLPDLEGLRAALAVSRIVDPSRLGGRDIRFLRKALGCSGKDLAERLDVNPATVSRWENDKEAIGTASERLLRLIVGAELADEVPAVDYDEREILGMRVVPAHPAQVADPIRLEYIAFKMPRRPRTRQWGVLEPVA